MWVCVCVCECVCVCVCVCVCSVCMCVCMCVCVVCACMCACVCVCDTCIVVVMRGEERGRVKSSFTQLPEELYTYPPSAITVCVPIITCKSQRKNFLLWTTKWVFVWGGRGLGTRLSHLVDPGHDGKDGGVGDECGFNSSRSQVVCKLLSLVGRSRLGHYYSKLAFTGSSL